MQTFPSEGGKLIFWSNGFIDILPLNPKQYLSFLSLRSNEVDFCCGFGAENNMLEADSRLSLVDARVFLPEASLALVMVGESGAAAGTVK